MREPGAPGGGMLMAQPGTPYAERADAPPGAADRAIAAAWSWVEGGPLRAWRRHAVARLADATIQLAPAVAALSDARFREQAATLREHLVSDGLQPPLVAQAFAMAREATRRELGLLHHRVQLMGGAAMLTRSIAEMETGEGKTITALLPAAVFALAGRPVHVVTVNDYLASRDATQLRNVYAALGLSVGIVIDGQTPAERRAAYRRDVVYCTNKDLVFDYLRDRMAIGTRRSHTRRAVDDLVGAGWEQGRGAWDGPNDPANAGLYLRGLHVAIVDEADSVLIDEARTPLILSRSEGSEGTDALYATALRFARRLQPGRDYTVNAEQRSLSLTTKGRAELTGMANGLEGLWAARRAREELAEQALKALLFFIRDAQYVLAEGKVQIVDEYTGRVMPDRTWEHGLHQMVEAKEGCEISGRRQTIARITYQRFFARYGHLCGMTGTAAEGRAELSAVYGLRVLRVPTHHPLRRHPLPPQLATDADAKWTCVVQRAQALAGQGRAVLIGTRSVAASEHVAALLQAAGSAPMVLNAQQSREEAAVVARAGQAGCITVATNMAGRGTDIRLGKSVREAGGLHVILTEFHESARIDRQLFGRCARQGDPGSIEAIVAADDEMFQRFASARQIGIARAVLRLIDRPGWHRWGRWPGWSRWPGWIRWRGQVVARLARSAQRRAERMNARIRRDTLREDARLETALAFAGRGE